MIEKICDPFNQQRNAIQYVKTQEKEKKTH